MIFIGLWSVSSVFQLLSSYHSNRSGIVRNNHCFKTVCSDWETNIFHRDLPSHILSFYTVSILVNGCACPVDYVISEHTIAITSFIHHVLLVNFHLWFKTLTSVPPAIPRGWWTYSLLILFMIKFSLSVGYYFAFPHSIKMIYWSALYTEVSYLKWSNISSAFPSTVWLSRVRIPGRQFPEEISVL